MSFIITIIAVFAILCAYSRHMTLIENEREAKEAEHDRLRREQWDREDARAKAQESVD